MHYNKPNISNLNEVTRANTSHCGNNQDSQANQTCPKYQDTIKNQNFHIHIKFIPGLGTFQSSQKPNWQSGSHLTKIRTTFNPTQFYPNLYFIVITGGICHICVTYNMCLVEKGSRKHRSWKIAKLESASQLHFPSWKFQSCLGNVSAVPKMTIE